MMNVYSINNSVRIFAHDAAGTGTLTIMSPDEAQTLAAALVGIEANHEAAIYEEYPGELDLTEEVRFANGHGVLVDANSACDYATLYVRNLTSEHVETVPVWMLPDLACMLQEQAYEAATEMTLCAEA